MDSVPLQSIFSHIRDISDHLIKIRRCKLKFGIFNYTIIIKTGVFFMFHKRICMRDPPNLVDYEFLSVRKYYSHNLL